MITGTLEEVKHNVEIIDRFLKAKIFPRLRDGLDNKFSFMYNAYLPEKLNLDREVITDRLYSVADKSYYCRVWDNEGVRLSKEKIKVVGLAVKKSNTPKFFRQQVLKTMTLLLDEDYSKIIEIEKETKDKIRSASPKDLSSNVNINSLNYQFEENSGKLYGYEKGKKLPAPIHTRGAIFHNIFIEKNNIDIRPLEEGEKCKMIFLKLPNPLNSDVLSFVDENIFKYKNLKDHIDYDLILRKYYYNILELVRKPLNLYEEESFDDW